MRNTSRQEPTGAPSGSSPTGHTPSRTSAADADEPSADDGGSDPSLRPLAPRGRRTSVRNRLVLGLAVSVVAVLLAGTPVVYQATQELSRSQQLVEQAEFSQRALSLSHALADERDALTTAVAVAVAGTGENGAGTGETADPDEAGAATAPVTLPEDDLARVDRRIEELRPDASESLLEQLDAVTTAREQARQGNSSPAEVHHAYTDVLQELGDVTRAAHRNRPERALDATAEALPDLARGVESAAASRTLLLAALAGTGPQQDLVGLAQRAQAREAAALDDFAATADDEGYQRYARTVTGAPVTAAEEELDRLTAEPYLSEEARQAAPSDLDATLAARLELQRGALSTLAGTQRDAVADVRDSDMTALQWRIGLLGAALLLALGFGVHTARSLTRPLAAVRLGSRRLAEDPAGQQPVRYTGRDDEFATVVAAVNALHARAVELHRQGVRATENRGDLHSELESLRGTQQELVERMAAQTNLMHTTLLYHARRSLDLAGEQLTVIDRLEEHETDPDGLATLFALDHLAARMRRHSENVLLLNGVEIAAPPPAPVPLVDVAYGALSEAARYELVDVDQRMPGVRVSQPAARDLSHLLAELLDNATAFAPPGTRVRMAGTTRDGGVTVSVSDDGPGLDEETLTAVNAQLAAPAELPPAGDREDSEQPGPATRGDAGGDPRGVLSGELDSSGTPVGMGLYTVARLAVRHGLRPRLVARPDGGLRADVEIPTALVQLPGSVAAPAVPTEGDSGWRERADAPTGATRHGSGHGPTGAVPLQRSGSPDEFADPVGPGDPGDLVGSGDPADLVGPGVEPRAGSFGGADPLTDTGFPGDPVTGSLPPDSSPAPTRPYGADPYGADPFGVGQDGAEPYGADPFGVGQDGTDPYGVDPYGVGQGQDGADPYGVDPYGVGQNGPVPASPAVASAEPAHAEPPDTGATGPEPEPEHGTAAGLPGPSGAPGRADTGGTDVRPPAASGPSATTAGGLPIRVPAAALGGVEERSLAGDRAAGDRTQPAATSVDPEELRRRLGGFQRGAKEGHQDAASAGPPGEEEMQS